MQHQHSYESAALSVVRLIAALTALVLLVAACGGSSGAATQTAATQSAATATAPATDVATSTPTPATPTPVPEPTATAVPTATPEPEPTLTPEREVASGARPTTGAEVLDFLSEVECEAGGVLDSFETNLEPRWQEGMTRFYDVTTFGEQPSIDGEVVVTSPSRATVLAANASSWTIEWTTESSEFSGVSALLGEAATDVPEDEVEKVSERIAELSALTVSYDLGYDGILLGATDPDAAAQSVFDIYEGLASLFADLGAPPEFGDSFRAAAAAIPPETAVQSLLELPTMLHIADGWALEPGVPFQQSFDAPNGLGGGIPVELTTTLDAELSPGGCAILRNDQEVTPEAVAAAVVSFFELLGLQDDETTADVRREFETSLQQIETSSVAVWDLVKGIPVAVVALESFQVDGPEPATRSEIRLILDVTDDAG